MNRFLLAILLAAAGIASAAAPVQSPCPPKDRACAIRLMDSHPTKRASFWRHWLDKPLEERFGSAPPELVQLLAIDNVSLGYPNVPRASTLSAKFVADVKRALAGIPESIRRKAAPKLAGIFFVDDIGGSGFTDQVLNAKGKDAIGFIVLDPTILAARTANAWATWKDNTPFTPEDNWSLTTRIENAASDDTVHAIQYILLHELGHVISIGESVHPSWTLSPSQVGRTDEYEFFNLSWLISGDRYVLGPAAPFAQREDVRYYFGAKLRASKMVDVYRALDGTNLPTLYAATHPGDDFAESFANYVHVVMMRKPYEVRILNGGATARTYGPCWSEPRCAKKRAYLEAFLGRE